MISILNYMRKRLGLTQQKLANATKLTANDICRLENGRLPGINKAAALADYLKISIDALLTNNVEEVFSAFSEPCPQTHKLQKRMMAKQAICDEISRKGEEWVYQQEIEKLQGTIYANGVNPQYSEDPDSGCDIMSFERDGTEIFIEVKTTAGKASNIFFLSVSEEKMARKCLSEGVRYEIHRVYNVNKKPARVIIPVDDLFKDYVLEADNYKVRKKVS